NYLEVIESLVQNTLDGFSDQIGSIICRNDYAHARGAAPVPRGLIQVSVSHISIYESRRLSSFQEFFSQEICGRGGIRQASKLLPDGVDRPVAICRFPSR